MLRSRRLAAGIITAVQVLPAVGGRDVGRPVYTTPQGHRAIVREALFYLHEEGGFIQLLVVLGGSGETISVWYNAITEPVRTYEFRGDLVLEPGDTLYLFCTGTSVNYYISGAELVLP